MVVNIVATKVRGEPVYPIMRWESPGDLFIPVLASAAGALLFYALLKINQKCKIRKDL